jgi:general transcription factor 3C polypeptide 5 (transcription factor C subunit 1)
VDCFGEDCTTLSRSICSYKANSTSIESTTIDSITGKERERLVNKQRWKGWAPVSITYGDPVPHDPPENAKAEETHVEVALLKRLKQVEVVFYVRILYYLTILKLFDVRPAWTRNALFNQCTAHEVRELTKYELLLQLGMRYLTFTSVPSSYFLWFAMFSKMVPGETHLFALGMIPGSRKPRECKNRRFIIHAARFQPRYRYQRLYFRNVNHGIERASLVSRRYMSRLQKSNIKATNVVEAHDDAKVLK